MMSMETLHVVVEPGFCGGQPHLRGRRVKVQHVADWYERQGLSIESICEQFGLGPAEVHAALAYYHDHREEIDQDRLNDEAFAERVRREQPSGRGQAGG